MSSGFVIGRPHGLFLLGELQIHCVNKNAEFPLDLAEHAAKARHFPRDVIPEIIAPRLAPVKSVVLTMVPAIFAKFSDSGRIGVENEPAFGRKCGAWVGDELGEEIFEIVVKRPLPCCRRPRRRSAR